MGLQVDKIQMLTRQIFKQFLKIIHYKLNSKLGHNYPHFSICTNFILMQKTRFPYLQAQRKDKNFDSGSGIFQYT